MVSEDPNQIPGASKNPPRESDPLVGGQSQNDVFSPRFKSVAAMAGWDEEALLIASFVVDDTPDRESKHKKRSDLLFKTPPSNSRRYPTNPSTLMYFVFGRSPKSQKRERSGLRLSIKL